MANVTIKSGGVGAFSCDAKAKMTPFDFASQVIPNIHTVLMPQKTSAKGAPAHYFSVLLYRAVLSYQKSFDTNPAQAHAQAPRRQTPRCQAQP